MPTSLRADPQHAGHSRTIVGYEQLSNGHLNLLLFDPARRSVPTDIRNAGIDLHFSRLSQTPSHRSSPTIRRVSRNNLRKPSHESINFSPPYTNGASELVHLPEEAMSQAAPVRISGGGLEEDEEMDEEGWVRKRIRKVSQSIRVPPAKVPKRPSPWEGSGVSKGIGYFRVNVGAIT